MTFHSLITTLLLASSSIATSAQTALNLKNAWGDIDSDIAPWASNVSRPNKIKKGLEGRHISLWASHGRYFDNEKCIWKWQRPNLFCTNEDLFTQTIVVPYLIPMLENAGAYVFTPRERDWQKHEIIVDNDVSSPAGSTFSCNADNCRQVTGFKMHEGEYYDGESPFQAGSALAIKADKPKNSSFIYYTPNITEAGKYAVYVSYPRLDDAVDDVHYTVCHKGIQTDFVVNQQIGQGTWVYLGTFDFDVTPVGDQSKSNCVMLSTMSRHKGHIGADAVRFGGGMGNIRRGDSTSGLPRCLEGARYYGQWAGATYSVYSDKMGENDYGDDINVRSLMTNWLGGQSCFMPASETGGKVPIELSLAVHSDAGYNHDGKSVFGSLAIATTNFNDGILSSGISRQTSLDLASQLLDNLNRDMTREFGTWGKRYLWDRNYSETRLPEVPSAIIETLSHQSFPDMKIAQHPVGKFAIARSIYKTVLKYICNQHAKKYVVTPLAPIDFRIETADDNRIRLTWKGVKDADEPTSAPTSYNIYTAVGDGGFDNGQNIESTTATMKLIPGMRYSFKITACNDGGESFASETLSAYIAENPIGEILVINGFERLSAPCIIDNDAMQGFDIDADEGVQRGLYAGWCGRQRNFDKSAMGMTGEQGLGYSGNELTGVFIAGNDFNYTVDHVRSIASTGRYNVVSTSLSAVNKQEVNLNQYKMVDIAFGLQKDDGQLGLHYKTFTPSLQSQLEAYARQGGAILTSGSFLGSDMMQPKEASFMRRLLKSNYITTADNTTGEDIVGLGMQYSIYRTLNDKHYAATHPEVLSATDDAICAMQYADGTSAAVGYKGTYSCFTMGFPFECIKDRYLKDKIMQGIIAYLIK